MADYHNPNEFRLSSSAFAWGDLVFTDYKSGCFRKILIQSRGVRDKIKPQYTELGALNEQRHEDRLKSEGQRYLREHAVGRGIAGGSGVTLSGHIDFLLYDRDGINAASVDELKSVSSTNTRRNVIKNGHYVTENLAQIVSYMAETRVQNGRLIYTYYQEGEAVDERTFRVTLDEFGKIFVDSKATQFSYHDILSHQSKAAAVIKDGTVGPRPFRWEFQFVSPCTFCPYKQACDQYDAGAIEGAESFVKYAEQLLISKETEK
jgi:hypothetical protein